MGSFRLKHFFPSLVEDEIETAQGFGILEEGRIDDMGDDIGFSDRGNRQEYFSREEFVSNQGAEGWVVILVIQHDPGVRFLGNQLALNIF